jgi:hypothetical protein
MLLFLVTIFAGLVVIWLLETMCRAQAIYDMEHPEAKNHEQKIDELFYIGSRKFEINEMCAMFLGRIGKILYEIALSLYMYGGLWSYAAVFAQSMASTAPFYLPKIGWYTCDALHDNGANCHILYLIYVALFAMIVVPLTCLNLTEQKLIQVLLTIFRYVALALMIVVIFISIFTDPYSRYKENPHKSMERQPPYLSPFSWANGAGIHILLPVCIFSQILHHSTPGLSQPVRNKKHLPWIFSFTFMTTYLFYTLLGVTLSIYYGPNIENTASLNFAYYRGDVPFGWKIPLFARLITLVIVLFPAIDVLSAFPLNGITLGNNIHAAFCANRPNLLESRKVQVFFRFVAAIPPLIGACIISDLGVIFKYVGLLGFIITFIIPPILQIKSKYYVYSLFDKSETPYTYPILSHNILNLIVVMFGAGAVISCTIMTTIHLFKD